MFRHQKFITENKSSIIKLYSLISETKNHSTQEIAYSLLYNASLNENWNKVFEIVEHNLKSQFLFNKTIKVIDRTSICCAFIAYILYNIFIGDIDNTKHDAITLLYDDLLSKKNIIISDIMIVSIPYVISFFLHTHPAWQNEQQSLLSFKSLSYTMSQISLYDLNSLLILEKTMPLVYIGFMQRLPLRFNIYKDVNYVNKIKSTKCGKGCSCCGVYTKSMSSAQLISQPGRINGSYTSMIPCPDAASTALLMYYSLHKHTIKLCSYMTLQPSIIRLSYLFEAMTNSLHNILKVDTQSKYHIAKDITTLFRSLILDSNNIDKILDIITNSSENILQNDDSYIIHASKVICHTISKLCETLDMIPPQDISLGWKICKISAITTDTAITEKLRTEHNYCADYKLRTILSEISLASEKRNVTHTNTIYVIPCHKIDAMFTLGKAAEVAYIKEPFIGHIIQTSDPHEDSYFLCEQSKGFSTFFIGGLIGMLTPSNIIYESVLLWPTIYTILVVYKFNYLYDKDKLWNKLYRACIVKVIHLCTHNASFAENSIPVSMSHLINIYDIIIYYFNYICKLYNSSITQDAYGCIGMTLGILQPYTFKNNPHTIGTLKKLYTCITNTNIEKYDQVGQAILNAIKNIDTTKNISIVPCDTTSIEQSLFNIHFLECLIFLMKQLYINDPTNSVLGHDELLFIRDTLKHFYSLEIELPEKTPCEFESLFHQQNTHGENPLGIDERVTINNIAFYLTTYINQNRKNPRVDDIQIITFLRELELHKMQSHHVEYATQYTDTEQLFTTFYPNGKNEQLYFFESLCQQKLLTSEYVPICDFPLTNRRGMFLQQPCNVCLKLPPNINVNRDLLPKKASIFWLLLQTIRHGLPRATDTLEINIRAFFQECETILITKDRIDQRIQRENSEYKNLKPKILKYMDL